MLKQTKMAYMRPRYGLSSHKENWIRVIVNIIEGEKNAVESVQ